MKSVGVYTGVLYSDLNDKVKESFYLKSVENLRSKFKDIHFILIVNGEFEEYTRLEGIKYIETDLRSLFAARMYAFKYNIYDKILFMDFGDLYYLNDDAVSEVYSDFDVVAFSSLIVDVDEDKLTYIINKSIECSDREDINNQLLFRSPVIYISSLCFERDCAERIYLVWSQFKHMDINFSEDTMLNILSLMYSSNYKLSSNTDGPYIRESSGSMFRSGSVLDKVKWTYEVLERARTIGSIYTYHGLSSTKFNDYIDFILSKKLSYIASDGLDNINNLYELNDCKLSVSHKSLPRGLGKEKDPNKLMSTLYDIN